MRIHHSLLLSIAFLTTSTTGFSLLPRKASFQANTGTSTTTFKDTTKPSTNGKDRSVSGENRFVTELKAIATPSSNDEKELDVEAIGKYAISAGVEMVLLTLFLRMLDFGMSPERGMGELPLPAITAIFYALSLKSRVFNPLNNQRPDLKKASTEDKPSKGFGDRIMPKWTPPGVFFPILWIFINAPLRAYSTTLIYEVNGHVLCDPTILCLMLHLTMGDIWNTINNTERRLGASVTGVATVWTSVWYAIYRYYEVDPLAGKLLGLTGVWITIAAALVTNTWTLNLVNEKLDSLLPLKAVGSESITKFSFEDEK